MQPWIEELSQSLAEKKESQRRQILILERSREVDLPRFFQPVITEDFKIAANSFGVR